MSNPLFGALNGNAQQMNDGGFSKMVQELQSFRNSFRGDPRAEVQRLINSGQMSQAKFNQLGQMANQIIGLMK